MPAVLPGCYVRYAMDGVERDSSEDQQRRKVYRFGTKD